MKLHSSFRGLTAVAAAVLALCSVSASAEQIKEGVHPQVNGSPVTLMKDNLITQALGGRVVNLDVWAGEFIRYDNNIFNTSKDKESDVIYSTAAGLLLQAGEDKLWKTKLEAQAQYNKYGDNSEYDGVEGFMHFDSSLDFSPALTGRVNFGYDKSYDNVRDQKDIYDTMIYTAGTGVTVRPTEFFGIDVDYRYLGQRRDQTELKYTEYDEHGFIVRPSFALTPNTSLYVQGSYLMVDSKGNWYGDVDTTGLVAGASWAYRDTANLYAELGAVHMSFDEVNHTGIDENGGSITKASFRLGGKLALNADTSISGQLSYAPSVGATTTSSKNSAYVESWRLSATAQYSPGAGRLTVQATPFWSHYSPSNNVSYREFGATLGTAYCITDWLNVSAGYRYTNTKYSDASSYDRHQLTVGIAGTF